MADPQIQIPFAGGPDEATDPRHLPPGSVISATNQQYDQEGQYQVRYGFTQIGANTTPTAIRKLVSYGTELLAVDGTSLWTYSDKADAWESRDTVSPCGVTYKPIQSATSSFASWAYVVSSGYRVVAWIDTTDSLVRAAVYSVATGAIVYGPTLVIATGSWGNISLGVIGTIAIVVAGGSSGIAACTLPLSPLGTWNTNVATLSSVGLTYNSFGCTFLSDRFVIAYESASGTLRAASYDSTLNLIASNTVSPSGYSHFVAIAAQGTTGEAVYVGVYSTSFGGSDSCWMLTFNASTLGVIGGVFGMGNGGVLGITRVGLSRLSSAEVLMATHAASSPTTYLRKMNQTTGAQEVLMTLNNVGLASSPFYVSQAGSTWCYLATPYTTSGSQVTSWGTYFLCDLQTGSTWSGSGPGATLLKVLAPTIVGVAADAATAQVNVPVMATASSSTYEMALPISRSGGRLGLDRFTIDFAANHRWLPATLGLEQHIGGERYDGNRLVENGFPYAPQVLTVTNDSGGGGSFTGTYEFCVTYVWVDAHGNEEESLPSAPVKVNTSAWGGFSVQVTTPTISRKLRFGDVATGTGRGASRVFVRVYRSQDLAGGDTLHYLLNVDPLPVSSACNPTQASLTINDAQADTTISSHRTLYTDSGELGHDVPESPTFVTAHKNRPWMIGADQRTIWFGQQYSAGRIPAYSDSFQMTVDDAGEDLIALASQYDKLHIFTANKIYVVFGDGPSVAGTGSDLQDPTRVPSPSGCIDPRSLVNTPLGIMFQSKRGIEVIGPDQSVQFIGLPVSTTTKNYPVCTSATYCDDSSTVRFTFVQNENVPATGYGVVALFDVRRNRWAVHQITCAGQRGNVAGAPCLAATWHPVYGYVEGHNDVASVAIIGRENTTADAAPWVDFGTYFIPLSVTLAWVKSGDLQGWGSVRRVRLLGNYYDAHGLQAVFNTDYQTQNDTHSYTSATVAQFVNGSYEQVRFIPVNQKCQAIQATFTTVAPTAPQTIGSGRGAGFVGVSFEVHRKPGGWPRATRGQST